MEKPRQFGRFLFDRFAGWLMNLPRETGTYTITPVRIPLRDGVELAADLYRPVLSKPDAQPLGQLLVQGPYGRGVPIAIADGSVWAARGYQVLLVSCRGTWGSGGQLDPGRTEAADGQDIVKWMRSQPWYPGAFATFGASYMGYTQWALLHDPPPDLIACMPSVAPHDYSRHHWGTGAFRLDRVVWSHGVDMVGNGNFFARVWRVLRDRKRVELVLKGIPLLEAVKSHFGSKAPWLARVLVRPDITDEYYRPMQHAGALELLDVPVMLGTGWYDPFLYQTMEQYGRLRERGVDVELIIGPWNHSNAANVKIMPELYLWMEEHVAKRAKRDKKLPVRVFVTGAEEWKDLPRWPPATKPTALFLQPEQGLAGEPVVGSDSSSSFTFDPLDPTPSIGGPQLMGGGSAEDSSLAVRSDVLAFTSQPLRQGFEIAGTPYVELFHSSDSPFVDIFVRMSVVDAKGRSRNVAEGFRRLQPGETPGTVRLEMNDCAHKFIKGSRVRLLVAGGSFPLYSPNLGTEESAATAVTVRAVRHTIDHGTTTPSRLVLPVLAGAPTGI